MGKRNFGTVRSRVVGGQSFSFFASEVSTSRREIISPATSQQLSCLLQKRLFPSPRGRQQLCPSPSAATPPVFPTGCPGFISPHHSPPLLQAHPTEPQLPEPGRARDTQAMLWDGHQELPPTAPQHNKTKSYLNAPSLTAELDWSPGTLVSASA